MATAATTAPAARPTINTRPGASRRLLQRKQAERAAEAAPAGEAREDVFPGAEIDQADAGQADMPGKASAAEQAATAPAQPEPSATSPSEPESAPSEPGAPQPAQVTAVPPAWSSADESALQAMLARRKAAGFVRRGPDVSAQLIRAGAVQPNPGTVVAAIVAIAAEHGPLSRGRLLDMMQAGLGHPKAKPADRGWCQGYVAGAVSIGFLVIAEAQAVVGDALASPPEPIESSRGLAA